MLLVRIFYLNLGLNPLNICIEVSSHAIDQKRLSNISSFRSASILNITKDHLDYHKSLSSYIDTKFDIFKIHSPLKFIDEESNQLKDHNEKVTIVGNKKKSSDIFYEIKKIYIYLHTIFTNSLCHFYLSSIKIYYIIYSGFLTKGINQLLQLKQYH